MNSKYRISLYFDPNGYWVAEHPELSGCIADGETAHEALSSLEITRELWIESRVATGLEVPRPQEEPQYSGKFLLRIAKSMHRELAKEADVEGVSLNTHVSNVLSGRNTQRNQPAATKEDLQEMFSSFMGSKEHSSQDRPESIPNFGNVRPAPKFADAPTWGNMKPPVRDACQLFPTGQGTPNLLIH